METFVDFIMFVMRNIYHLLLNWSSALHHVMSPFKKCVNKQLSLLFDSISKRSSNFSY